MNSTPQNRQPLPTRRAAAIALLTLALEGCGGGSYQPMEGTSEVRTITSQITRTDYSLSIYLPPASAGPRDHLPVIYMLDGESWFETLVGIVESTRTRIIIVGINGSGQRNRDFVPANSCTPSGGGNASYFNFIRQELLPYVEGTIGGDPGQRTLFGHSHGGSFVLYAVFSEAPDQHSFKTYLASDASVSCMPSVAYGWEATYASTYHQLPVRLHLSYATQGNYDANVAYASDIAQRNYEGLVFLAKAYAGTHGGIVPQVLADSISFALSGSP